jgi:hypothetical protein
MFLKAKEFVTTASNPHEAGTIYSKRGCMVFLGEVTTIEEINSVKEKILTYANTKGLPYVAEGHEYPILKF